MATVPTQVRIDENLKKQATELFSQLGMDMSSAMNIFLRQCVMRGGLPFEVVIPQYKSEVLEAMEEAKRLSKETNAKRYSNFSDAMEALDWCSMNWYLLADLRKAERSFYRRLKENEVSLDDELFI